MPEAPKPSSPETFTLTRIDHAWSGINDRLGEKALLNLIGGGGATYAAYATLSPNSNIIDYLAVLGLYFLLPNAFINSHTTSQYIESAAEEAVSRDQPEAHAEHAIESIQSQLWSFNMPTLALGASLALGVIAATSSASLTNKAIFCTEALATCVLAFADAKRDSRAIKGLLYRQPAPK